MRRNTNMAFSSGDVNPSFCTLFVYTFLSEVSILEPKTLAEDLRLSIRLRYALDPSASREYHLLASQALRRPVLQLTLWRVFGLIWVPFSSEMCINIIK